MLEMHELSAMLEAGEIAATYLEERRLLVGYEHALRRRILDDEPSVSGGRNGTI
jgi:hypothetical protein